MLELICGPMYSGKSTELIRRVKRLTSIGKDILIINSSKDTRCNEELQTHDNIQLKAVKVLNLEDIINLEVFKKCEYLAIDESQFFPDLVNVIKDCLFIYNKKCLIAGLDGDFRQNKFGGILDLIPLCTKIDKLTGYCSYCKDGTEAHYSIRTTNENNQEIIGSKESYECVCFLHMKKFIEIEKIINNNLEENYSNYKIE